MFGTRVVYYCLLTLLFGALVVSASVTSAQDCTRDFLFEFKAAAFIPKDNCFEKIYGRSGVLYGPELTCQLDADNECWYGFVNVDHFSKDGCSIGLKNPTEVSLTSIGFGLKYFMSCCSCADFYLGLGFQPVHVRTTNCSSNVIQSLSSWAFGGIAKAGFIVDLACDLFLDIFVDYSFAKTSCKNDCANSTPIVTLIRADVSGAIVGAGLGYRF